MDSERRRKKADDLLSYLNLLWHNSEQKEEIGDEQQRWKLCAEPVRDEQMLDEKASELTRDNKIAAV